MKRIILIFIIALTSCSKTDQNNFIEKEKDRLNHIILRQVNFFDKLNKDTLVVRLKPFSFCGNDPIKYVDCSPMFVDIKTKASEYGYKTVLLDTMDLFNPKYKSYSNVPHYDLFISLDSNVASITQLYTYIEKAKIIQTKTDTTIEI
ncbi:MAG: hypothetical protein C0448_02595 [Sphingobacteriaceae bacterium]|nr:hypothetical protein [Sphingobacteriaceae bacterium]